ncbi:alpha-2-macroglobulin domain protein [Cellulophaga algicola DSM 14237]|uniref:Alpha-2-macroglobulin domain protein n=1 Tax=Cellulophaga algicola (strain DSM 14237 / IC166 / ACAM 630) TaxID=688270 RepID=E6XD73_CELAD|nr:MG2 domain-containing protein [Cellulophaga algicola]ADV47986.1 alpha-2-macroglobulin domain protein [Cellulophaga algicola DSM 14237]
MKQATVFVLIILFSHMAEAQGSKDSFETLWKKVAQLEQEGLTKSALSVVSAISEKAKKESNNAQVVKSLLFSSKYSLTLEEDAQLKIISEFKSEIETATTPTKNVLESYLANLYWQYYQQNRYQFYKRTETETKVDTTDFRTWDLNTLFYEIGIHFDASLENSETLKKIPVSAFEILLDTQDGSEKLRPTLYDLLAHTALNFYKTDENNITRPADKFEINDSELLCESYQFILHKINTTDKTSLQAKALQLYQELLQFHSADKTSDAYVTIDIERLHFIKNKAVFSNVGDFYLNILQNSAEHIKAHENWSLYQFEIASYYAALANMYDATTNDEHRWKNKEALALCETIIKKHPKNLGALKSQNLKATILSKSMHLTNEEYIPTDKISRLLLNYKNIDALSVTAYNITRDQFQALEDAYKIEEKVAIIKKLKAVKNWEASLKNEMDYQNHAIEIEIPTLANGYYLLVARDNKLESNSFAYSSLNVTDIVLSENQLNGNHSFQVIDRNNGAPIPNAQVRLTYRINYDDKYLNKTYTSDENGNISFEKSEEYWTDVTIRVTANKEVAFFTGFYINHNYSRNNEEYTSYTTFLFTDRSIYRPGQPLFFKGIAVADSNSEKSIVTATDVTVKLLDANYQEVSSQNFKTNEYGSFSGEFILPSNGLTGNFSLQASNNTYGLNGSANFSVEEYKRPKFEAHFNPVTETYRVNDRIKVHGKAMAYAGSAISDAKVTYRVKRAVYYPRWYYWYRSYHNNTPQEIAFGETTTDASGNFELDFKAIVDHSTSAKNLPTFSYEVTADITDINGETHSTATTVNVGYHALNATIAVANRINKNANENKLAVYTTNLNGKTVASSGTLKIYKLKAPSAVLRPRPWTAPDYDYFGKEKFKAHYPHDAYANEYDSNTWENADLLWETQFNTSKTNELSLPNLKKWPSGKYRIELVTTDKFGQLVEEKVQTTLYSTDDKSLADQQIFSIATDKQSYEIGDKAKITLKTAAKDLYVTLTIEKEYKIVDTKIIHLSENKKSFTIPVNAEDLGGFAINYSYAAFNSYASGNVIVAVPYPVTDLQIETVTFRDKIKPGTDETWSFKIKGPKGDKVAAELLASMYDASLDAFRGHSWGFNPLYKPNYYAYQRSNANHSFGTSSFRSYWQFQTSYVSTSQYYDTFKWFDLNLGYNNRSSGYLSRKMMSKSAPATEMAEDIMEVAEMSAPPTPPSEVKKEKDSIANSSEAPQSDTEFGEVQIRKNLQETAFFFPQLQTDKEGAISFSFTTPEALTQWKLQLLAHTKNLESATTALTTVTQKELMVLPNAPRFLREGDQIVVSSKISNLTEKNLSGQAKIILTDAVLHTDITADITKNAQQEFSVDATGNTQVSWTITVPEGLQAVSYKILAKAGDFSDGEQNMWPVLSNRMLVTESLPMWVRSNQTKTFSLDKLKNSSSKTLRNHKLTLEITSNPAWYAVQALPYLMEYPYECNEQTFARYYANTLASYIANSNPKIQEVFNQWANSDALLSNLEKNQELKSLLIQETPWLRDAQSETEQKKRIALLFDLNKMRASQESAFSKLAQNQMSNGAWSWFAGGRENRYITQHIITGLGHLDKLIISSETGKEKSAMIKKAISYLDDAFVAEYEYMIKHNNNIKQDHLSHSQVQYLYMRSFFSDLKTSKKVDAVTAYYKGQIQKYWKNKNLYSKGMLALIMHRMGDKVTATKIIHHLEENSISSDELGMYWKENTNSWYWYQAPIETQALLIEAFSEIQKDVTTIDNLKIWLLKNKQTNQWKTTKATTEAVYALLLQGSDWLSVTNAVDVLIGGEKIAPEKLEGVKVEAGTGYYKTSWNTSEITSKMAEVQISKKGAGIAWGALYWQYFEDLDQITSAETPLKLKKKLFLKKNTATGEKISEITENSKLSVGDLVRVRIELRSDRDMEFIHMKDMRAAGFEPINVFSQYKWQDGLGYYESTKDASTNFFFDFLPKGVYVFEYDLRVNNAGNFSNGITTIQSMYAPEFSSHSEGVRVQIETN